MRWLYAVDADSEAAKRFGVEEAGEIEVLELDDAECSTIANALRVAGDEYERIASQDCDGTPEGLRLVEQFAKQAAEVRKLAEEIES